MSGKKRHLEMPDYIYDDTKGTVTFRSISISEGDGEQAWVQLTADCKTSKSDSDDTVEIPSSFESEADLFFEALKGGPKSTKRQHYRDMTGNVTISRKGPDGLEVIGHFSGSLLWQELVSDEPGKARAVYRFGFMLEPEDVGVLVSGMFAPVEVLFEHKQLEMKARATALPEGEA